MTETTSKGIVLIVDDTVENLRLLASMLEKCGYDARPVTSGKDALEAMSYDIPDLVLLDVAMPEMDGFEVCLRIKAKPEWHDVPVIFLTALTQVEDRVTGFSVGGVDYVTKPFHVDEVTARVASQIALRRARQDLASSLVELQALEKLRDELAQMIVHDMRGLLNVVIANLDMARRALTGQVGEDVSDALNAAHAVNRMANTVLDVSRLEEGKMPVHREPTNLTALAEETARIFGAVDRTRTIRCVAPGPVLANCDADLVRRVFENLVGNAVKHTPAGGTVTIDVKPADNGVRVSVQDDGRGVPDEIRATLFEKFAAARKESKQHSAGLGLAFCKLAVEAHGGAITVAPGEPKGSVFSFTIPD